MRWLLVLAIVGCGDDGTSSGDAGVPDGGGGGGPVANAGPDRVVIGGLVVPLDGTASSGAVAYAWSIANGPAGTLEAADAEVARLIVPPDAAEGTAWVLELQVTDAAGATATDTATVTVRDAVFESFLADVTDPAILGTTEGIAFTDDRMHVVSMGPPGWISTFDATGAFVARTDIGTRPVGVNFDRDGLLVVADAADATLRTWDPATGTIEELTTADLGPANYPLPDRDGNVYVSNRAGGQIWRVDPAGNATVFAEGFGENPNAIAFGPEEDVLYAGTIDVVYRVPIEADGSAGTPAVYVDGLGSEVDGLAFDIGGNLYAGCPNSGELFIIPYVAGGPSQPARSFQGVGGGVSLFTSATFGRGAFGEDTLYWTNLGQGTVGRMVVGLPGLAAPLSPPR